MPIVVPRRCLGTADCPPCAGERLTPGRGSPATSCRSIARLSPISREVSNVEWSPETDKRRRRQPELGTSSNLRERRPAVPLPPGASRLCFPHPFELASTCVHSHNLRSCFPATLCSLVPSSSNNLRLETSSSSPPRSSSSLTVRTSSRPFPLACMLGVGAIEDTISLVASSTCLCISACVVGGQMDG